MLTMMQSSGYQNYMSDSKLEPRITSNLRPLPVLASLNSLIDKVKKSKTKKLKNKFLQGFNSQLLDVLLV